MKFKLIIITNNLVKEKQLIDLDLIYVSDYVQLFADEVASQSFNKINIFIDGYVLPRNEFTRDYLNSSQHDMVSILYKEHKDGFTQFIKGIFCIVIMDHETIKVFNDHLGIYKFFYSRCRLPN